MTLKLVLFSTTQFEKLYNESGLNCSLLSSHFSQASSSFIRLTLELKARFCSSRRYVWFWAKLVAKGPVSLTGQVEISDWCGLVIGPWGVGGGD